MAIIPSQKNPLTILKKFRDELQLRTGITNFDRDSKARALSDTLTDELLTIREELQASFTANQLANARGRYLDNIGVSSGIERREATFASVSDIELSLAFYVETGNFGSINGGLPVNITEADDVILSTDPNNNELGATIEFRLEGNHTLPAADSIAYVSAVARISGVGSNVGKQTIRRHNFTGYTDSANKSLKVINFYPLLNGRDRESDNTYRFRISQRYSELLTVNNNRLLLRSLEVPGIISATPISGYFGIGSAGVIIFGAENQVNPRLVSAVQEKVNFFKPPGMRIESVAPTEVAFDFQLNFRTASAISIGQQQLIRAQVQRIALDFFRTLGTGSLVDLRNLAFQVQNETNNLVSFKSVDVSNVFGNIFIRKGLSNSNLGEREKLIKPVFQLDFDEVPKLGTLEIGFV